MTWPPVWRWRLTLPPPSTLSRLIQRPLVRSNLKGLNHTRSPCGTHGNSSTFVAMSGNAISSVKALSLSLITDDPFLSPDRNATFYHTACRAMVVRWSRTYGHPSLLSSAISSRGATTSEEPHLFNLV